MANEKEESVGSLVERAQNAGSGDHRAFKELVARYRGKILANCRFLTRAQDDAEDLAQEVFVKAFFGLKRLEKRENFPAWIKRIKVNHCLNFIRKRKKAGFVDLESEEAQMSDRLHVRAAADIRVDQAAQQEQIREILGTMSDGMRIPLILCDMDGLSYQEAADELGIGLSALKMRLKRAREHFRARFVRASNNTLAPQQRKNTDE